MSQKNSMIQRIFCNIYVCNLNLQHVNKTPVCLQYIFFFLHELRIGQSNRKKDKNVET